MANEHASGSGKGQRRKKAGRIDRDCIRVDAHQRKFRENDHEREDGRDQREDQSLKHRLEAKTPPEEECVENRPAHPDAEVNGERGCVRQEGRMVERDRAQLADEVDARQPDL